MWARLLFVVLCLSLAGAAQPEPLTLRDAVAIALERNPQRKAVLAETRMASAFTREMQAGYLPRLNFTETAVRSNDPVFVFGSKLRQDRFTAADFALNRLNTPTPVGNFATRFGTQWNVFDSFFTRANVRQANREKAAAEQRLSRTDQMLVLRVVQSYYGVLSVAKQAEVAEHAVNTAQSVMEESRTRFEAGSTVESDFLATQVNLAARKQELIRANNALALARTELNLAMGITPDHEYRPVEPASAPALDPPPLAEAETRALKERPDIKEIAEQVAGREAGVQAARSAFGPRVNLFAASELDNAGFFGNGGNNWTAGAELQFDIFSGGEKKARLDRAQAGLQRIEALRRVAEDSVRLDLRRAWYDFDAARQFVEVNRAAAMQAGEALRIVSNRYQAGMTTITEMLRSEDAARTAQRNYWDSVYRLSTSYAVLELAMGTLNSQSPVVTP